MVCAFREELKISHCFSNSLSLSSLLSALNAIPSTLIDLLSWSFAVTVFRPFALGDIPSTVSMRIASCLIHLVLLQSVSRSQCVQKVANPAAFVIVVRISLLRQHEGRRRFPARLFVFFSPPPVLGGTFCRCWAFLGDCLPVRSFCFQTFEFCLLSFPVPSLSHLWGASLPGLPTLVTVL